MDHKNNCRCARGPARFFIAASLVFLVLLSETAWSQDLAPGIDDFRPGVIAYTDLFHLCFWRDGITAGQMSSHDEQGRNIDLGHFHGSYKGGVVLAKIKGPGVVYRIWSAGPSGQLLFYPDGQTDPALDCGFQDYMDGKCGADPAFAVGQFANYTPISFRDDLTVTARNYRLEGAYYQISYVTFAQDPGLKSIAESGPLSDPAALESARQFWASWGRAPGRDPGGASRNAAASFTLEPGQSRELALTGAGLITELRIVSGTDPLETLETVNLKIYWDGLSDPAVDSPVDAFFGNRFDTRSASRTTAGSGAASYETLTASATGAGYSSRWPMPFARGVRVFLENRGPAAQALQVEADYREAAGLPDRAMRFHAQYREQDYPDDALTRAKVYGLSHVVDQSKNYVVLEESGQGWYVGCFLYVASLGSDWWGEGDEMIWVDGAPEAAVTGTGTEDEFNWSFSLKENRSPVSGALRVTRRKGDMGQDRVCYNALYRYRIGDLVPFNQKIKVTYERLGTTTDVLPRYPGSPVNVSSDRGDDYRSVAFWYELP